MAHLSVIAMGFLETPDPVTLNLDAASGRNPRDFPSWSLKSALISSSPLQVLAAMLNIRCQNYFAETQVMLEERSSQCSFQNYQRRYTWPF